MRHFSIRAIIAFFFSVVIGYGVSWWVMVGLLDTELRLYGFVNLTVVALLVAFILVTALDRPLKLEVFKWREGFWPKTLALPESKEKKKPRSRNPRGNTS